MIYAVREISGLCRERGSRGFDGLRQRGWVREFTFDVKYLRHLGRMILIRYACCN